MSNFEAVGVIVGATVVGRYLIKRVVKAGGMGAVFEAFDNRLQGPCALKEMHDSDDEWVRRRFREEATVLSLLKHAAIPHVRDFFQIGQRSYIVMDFVTGHNLTEELQAAAADGRRGLPADELRQVALTLLGILEYLHALQPPVLHCDIKPGNIIREEASGKIMLVDFGLARFPSDNTQTCAGTVQFCAPEQLAGHAEPRSDLYSLAATLYYLACAVVPVIGSTRPILTLAPGLDPKLARTIDQTLQVDPDKRPANAQAMRAILEGTGKPQRRLPILAALLLLLVAGGAGLYLRPTRGPERVMLAPQATLSRREALPLEQVPARTLQSFRELFQLLDAQHAVPGPSYCRYHVWDPPAHIDVDWGVLVDPVPAGSPGFQPGRLPGGPALRLIHKGNYDNLQSRFTELYTWVDEHHLKTAGGAWALYRVGYRDDPEPSHWITEVYWPIETGDGR